MPADEEIFIAYQHATGGLMATAYCSQLLSFVPEPGETYHALFAVKANDGFGLYCTSDLTLNKKRVSTVRWHEYRCEH